MTNQSEPPETDDQSPMNENDLKLLLKALAFAAARHKDQRRKDVDTSPYINHPIALADILCNEAHITDMEVICSALLHDTVEDTDTEAEEIESEFGRAIRDIVMEVSDDKTLPKEVRKQAQIEHASSLSDKARLVKLADKIANLRDVTNSPPPDWSLERRREYFDWGKAVVDRLRGVDAGLEAIFDVAYANRP
jgi:guanosine-3',5'-bis(diphosphate) 3'-pyrophosphohydrolase